MHKFAILVCSSLAATALAQSPLISNPGPNNQGNVGGGVYFDLICGAQQINITSLAWIPAAFPTTVTQGSMEIWMGPPTWEGNVTNAALWTLVTTTAATPLTATTMTAPAALATPICLAANTSYGIALKAVGGATTGFSHNYTNGTGQGCPTGYAGLPNPPGNQVVTNANLTFVGGAAQNAFLTGGVFCPRIWNGQIHYTVGPCATVSVAAQTQYGKGCYQFNTSYGELFPNASTSLDIAGQTHTLTFAGNIYVVSGSATNTFVPPGPNAVTLPLNAGGDVASVVAALGTPLPFPILYPAQHITGGVGFADDLEVCASGFITPVDVAGAGTTAAAPNAQAGDLTPTIGELFTTGLERWCPLWQTMAPAGTGITAEVVGPDLVITWNAVLVTGFTATPNSFQVVFSPGGNVQFRYDTSTTGNGGGGQPAIIGVTQGRGALPDEIDVSLSVLAGFSTEAVDNTAIDLELSARPRLGTNPNYVVSGYHPASTPLGAVILSFTQYNPGTSLAAFGMPGCFQHTDPIAIRTFITGGTSPATFPFLIGGIPTTGGFNGVEMYAQALSITGNCGGTGAPAPCNSLGVIASNGLRLLFGSL